MRPALACALVTAVWALSACATTPTSRVRNFDGVALPPYALNDATAPALMVPCLDGELYEVVDLPADRYVAGMQATQHSRDITADSICERIHTSHPGRVSR